jgi:UDP-glucose 4-epimerase
METVIVTGGAGFIGSHMTELLLRKGYKVIVIDNFSCGNLRNLKHLEKYSSLYVEEIDIRKIKPDNSLFRDVSYVFHFAGIGDIVPSIERPDEYMDVNVQGTVKVLEATRCAKVKKFVYAASSSCYGLAKTPTDENAPIDPKYPYALSKYLGEQICFHWNKIYRLPVNSIRIFNAYGTRSKTSGTYGAVFGVFLKQKIEKKPFTVVGDGTQRRDFIYVSDVANAFYLAGTLPISGEIFNLGNGNPQSVNKLVALLQGDVVFVPKRPSEPDCTWANISKIKRLLNWSPKVTFEQGVEKILFEIDYWKEAPLWDSDSIAEATKTWFSFLSS